MQVTCSVCQLTSLCKVEPEAGEAQFVCACCATEYTAVLVDNQVVLGLQPSSHTPERDANISPRESVQTATLVDASDDVLTVLPIEDAPLFVEPSPVPDDVFTNMRAAQIARIEAARQGVEAPRAAAGDELPGPAEPVASTGSHEPLASETAPVIVPEKSYAAAQDAYSAGTRVMQASPLWLLICGLAFIGCIVLFNRITTGVEGREEVASARSVVKNDATNQGSASFMPNVEIKSDAAESVAPLETRKNHAEETAKAIEQPVPAKKAQTPAAEKTAPVVEEKTQAVQSQSPVFEVQPPARTGGRFTIQVGAHSDGARAEAHVVQMKSAGFDARVVAVEIPKRGTWYRVQAGRFDTREEAARQGAQIRARGVAQSAMVTEVQ